MNCGGYERRLVTKVYGCLGFVVEQVMEKVVEERERIQTTIGDLIECITQIALEAGKSEAEGYRLASLTIESILRKNRKLIPVIN